MLSAQKPIIITALTVATVLGFSACQPKAPEKTVLKDNKDKVSYTVGYGFGKNISEKMKQSNVVLNTDAIVSGVHDAFANNPAITEEDMKAVMTAFSEEMKTKAEADAKALGEKSQKEGDDFLAANKTKDGVKTTPSGLQYKVLVEGKGTHSPKLTDTVTANYRGTLVNGTEFDSSARQGGKPVSFPVNRVIPGWTEALQLMKEGDKFQIYVPANLAYGEHSPSPDVIPPNSTLIFDIELISIDKGTPDAKSNAK